MRWNDVGADDEEKEGNSLFDCRPREKGPDDEGGGVLGAAPPDCVPRENDEGDCCESMDDDPLPGCPPCENGDCSNDAGNGLLSDGIPREDEEENDCPVLEENPDPPPANGLAAR